MVPPYIEYAWSLASIEVHTKSDNEIIYVQSSVDRPGSTSTIVLSKSVFFSNFTVDISMLSACSAIKTTVKCRKNIYGFNFHVNPEHVKTSSGP